MNDHLHALPPGHQLDEYRIERVIGIKKFINADILSKLA